MRTEQYRQGDEKGGSEIRVRNLVDLVGHAAQRWGEKTALRFDATRERLTFEEVHTRSEAIAKVLRAEGVTRGDRVCVMLKNVPNYPLAWLGIVKLGAVLVPMNIYYREHDARSVLAHSGATVVVATKEFTPLLRRLQQSVDPGFKIVVLDDKFASDDSQSVVHEDVSTGICAPQRITNIQYTSGTTGNPKGCMLSHNFWMRLAIQLTRDFPYIRGDDVLLTAQPYYYIDPQWNTVLALMTGAELVVLDRFHPKTFWAKVRQYNVSFFYCLGLMPNLLLQSPRDPNERKHSVRAIACSAIPVGKHVALERRWGVPWFEMFGMTETGVDLRMSPEEHGNLVGSGCIGRPYADREVCVAGPNDDPLPDGEIGELLIRGPGMMDGYYKDKPATEQVFRGGWMHTGDLALMCANGRVYFKGRKKNIVRRSGENISATEVEEVIQLHPAVEIAAVVATPDDLRGEEVKAYVVLRDPTSIGPASLIEFCKTKLAYYKVPRYWVVADSLPTTPSERVAKGSLVGTVNVGRERVYDGREGGWMGENDS